MATVSLTQKCLFHMLHKDVIQFFLKDKQETTVKLIEQSLFVYDLVL